MKVAHLYTTPDGSTHFRDIDLPPASPMGIADGFEVPGVQGAHIWERDGDIFHEFHTTSRRVLLVMLTGAQTVEASDGEVRHLGPGDAVLFDDKFGRGHKGCELTGPRKQLILYIDEALQVGEDAFLATSG